MIYLFDKDGRCFFKAGSNSHTEADHALHAASFGDQVANQIVSHIDYDIRSVYYSRGHINYRQPSPVVLEDIVLKNIPKGATIRIGSNIYVFDDPDNDGMMMLEFGFPGTYVITVSAWPYLDKSFKLVVP